MSKLLLDKLQIMSEFDCVCFTGGGGGGGGGGLPYGMDGDARRKF